MPARRVSQAEKVCRTFKAAQMAKGFTQEDVAKRLKVDRTTISRWYNSPYEMSVGNFCLLCQVLSIAPQNILAEYMTTKSYK